MKTIPSVVYTCPSCGQGGVDEVEVAGNSPFEAIICSECDRIWVAPKKLGSQNDEQLDDVQKALGMGYGWSKIKKLADGVPWDRVEEEYQLVYLNNPKLS